MAFLVFLRCGGIRAAAPGHFRTRLACVMCVRWRQSGEPWAGAHGCREWLRLVVFLRCGGIRAAAPGHFRTRLACGGLCALAAIRRAVGGSPRVLVLIAFGCVFAVWRRPCRGTRALPYPARLWGVCVGGNQASRGREPTGAAIGWRLVVFSALWRPPCGGTRALPYPARLLGA